MATKDKLTLTSVLESFEESLNKKAAETEQTAEKGTPDKVKANLGDSEDAVEKEEKKTKNEKGDTDDAAAEKEKGEPNKGDADDEAAKVEDKEKTAGVEGLKALAKTASENSEQAMVKEAQEFGRLFAHSVVEEMQKVAHEQEVYGEIVKQAYHVMEDELFMSKIAAIAGEAYDATLQALTNSGAYQKTAQVLESGEKIASAQDIEVAKTIVKEAYEITNNYLASSK